MKLATFVKILLLTLISLSACQTNENLETIIPTISPINIPIAQEATPVSKTTGLEPYVFKVSDPGFVTIKGYLLVFDTTTSLPDPNDAIYLVPLSGGDGIATIPTFTVGEVPQAEVDERTGDFVFTNIQPGQYAVVVLTMGQAQMPARFVDSGSYAIITVTDADIDHTIELEKIGIP